ncbi:glutathione S-transferase [Rhizoctonia solani]|nr:glutathione S-transferase [Rhizoctonia solani]
MVTVKLHGSTVSTCTKRVVTVCKEIGVQYEFVPVDLAAGEHKSEAFLEQKQPFGAVPVLVACIDEDGTQLYESRAICRYLTAKYGKDSGLLPDPSNPKQYGLFEQAASTEYSTFDPLASGLVWELALASAFGFPSDEKLGQKQLLTLKEKMDGYERILSKQKYLAGNSYTLADLFHLPHGAEVHKIDASVMDSKPNVKRWWSEITSRPAWKATESELGSV